MAMVVLESLRRGPRTATAIIFHSAHAADKSIIASGCVEATRSKTLAGPSGLRLPCSQFRNVATLIPIRAANFSRSHAPHGNAFWMRRIQVESFISVVCTGLQRRPEEVPMRRMGTR